jgi:Flp pilus assembly protein TadB
MADEQDIKIAVLEREVQGLREQHRAHKEEISQALREVAENFYDSLKEIRNDIKNIFEFINRGKGGLAVMLLLASVLSGVVVAIVSWALSKFLH